MSIHGIIAEGLTELLQAAFPNWQVIVEHWGSNNIYCYGSRMMGSVKCGPEGILVYNMAEPAERRWFDYADPDLVEQIIARLASSQTFGADAHYEATPGVKYSVTLSNLQ